MLETTHRKQPKSTFFFFSKKNQQLKTCSVWILRYYTLKKVTCPLKRGQFPPGKDRTPTTIFSVTSLEESPSGAENIHLPSWWKIPKNVVICVMFIPRSWSKIGTPRSEASPGGLLFIGHGFLATLKNHLCDPQQQKRNCNSNFFEGERLDGNKSNGNVKEVTNNALLEGKSIKLPYIWAKLRGFLSTSSDDGWLVSQYPNYHWDELPITGGSFQLRTGWFFSWIGKVGWKSPQAWWFTQGEIWSTPGFFWLTFQSSEHSTSKTKWKIEKWFASWLPPREKFRSFWIKTQNFGTQTPKPQNVPPFLLPKALHEDPWGEVPQKALHEDPWWLFVGGHHFLLLLLLLLLMFLFDDSDLELFVVLHLEFLS